MKEFDFDELDRAVSSLMEKATVAQPHTTEEAPRDSVATEPRASVAVHGQTEQSAVKVFTPSPASETSSNDAQSSSKNQAPDENVSSSASTQATEEDDRASSTDRSSATKAAAIHQRVQFAPTRRSMVSTPRPSEDEQTAASDEPKAADTPASSEKVMSQSPATADESVSRPAKSQTIPHRTGRFMDMKPTTSTKRADLAPPSQKPTRHGITLRPTSSVNIVDVVKPVQSEANETISPVASPAPVQPVDVPDEQTKDNLQYNDDLLAKRFDDLLKFDEVEPSVHDEESTTEAPTATTTLGESSSDFSAFLTDVKPEKRPLGGAESGETKPADEAEKAAATDDIEMPSHDDTDTASTQKDGIVRAEFDEKLMQIEAGDIEKRLPSGQEHAQKPSAQESAAAAPVAAAGPAPTRPQGPISIPRQYDELPSSGPEDNGAIFDTATYHKPLAHPAKKSHGWIWVLLIIAIILIGAGLGAVMYLGYI